VLPPLRELNFYSKLKMSTVKSNQVLPKNIPESLIVSPESPKKKASALYGEVISPTYLDISQPKL